MRVRQSSELLGLPLVSLDMHTYGPIVQFGHAYIWSHCPVWTCIHMVPLSSLDMHTYGPIVQFGHADIWSHCPVWTCRHMENLKSQAKGCFIGSGLTWIDTAVATVLLPHTGLLHG
jgi:hypothetical protein